MTFALLQPVHPCSSSCIPHTHSQIYDLFTHTLCKEIQLLNNLVLPPAEAIDDL